MRIPVIILNYNDYKTSDDFFGYVSENPKLLEMISIIYVDNHSEDDSFVRIREKYGELADFIQTEYNGGYARGNNYGVRYAMEKYNPRYVIIANPDIYFTAENIKEMSEALEESADYKLAGCKMLGEDGREQIGAWKLPRFRDDLISSLFLLNQIMKKHKICYEKEYMNKHISEVDVVNGSFFMIDTTAFLEAGCFCEDTFLYYEENILAYRLKELGYKEVIVNDSSYIHRHNRTIGKKYSKVSQRYKILQESRKVYYNKCLKISKIKLIVFDVVTAIGILERKIGGKFSVFRKL